MAFELLDMRDLRLFRDEAGALQMNYRGDQRGVSRVTRNFPKTNPDRYISLLDEEGHEIGIVEDPSTLDPSSREVMDAALRDVYFVPTIHAIRSIQIDGEASSWEVETDDGPRAFRVKERDDISTYDIPVIVITDVNNRKYRIEDYDELDPDSKTLINDLLPRDVVRLGKTYRSMARMQRGGGFGRL